MQNINALFKDNKPYSYINIFNLNYIKVVKNSIQYEKLLLTAVRF